MLSSLLLILDGNHLMMMLLVLVLDLDLDLNRALLLHLLLHLRDDTLLLLHHRLPLDLELTTPHVDRVGREHTAATVTTSTASMATGIATDGSVGGEAIGSATNLVVAMIVAAASAEEAGRQSRAALRQRAASTSGAGPAALLLVATAFE